MAIDTKCRHITPAGGNIFADLGFASDEAARLKAESDAMIAKELEFPRPQVRCTHCGVITKSQRAGDGCHSCQRGVMQQA